MLVLTKDWCLSSYVLHIKMLGVKFDSVSYCNLSHSNSTSVKILGGKGVEREYFRGGQKKWKHARRTHKRSYFRHLKDHQIWSNLNTFVIKPILGGQTRGQENILEGKFPHSYLSVVPPLPSQWIVGQCQYLLWWLPMMSVTHD